MIISIVLIVLFQTHILHSINPVLLVPGDGGSIIEARNIKTPPHVICGICKEWFVLWLNLYYITPITVKCFVDSIMLEYNAQNRTTASPEFCETQVNGFGTSDAVEYFSSFKIKSTSYFHYLIDDLVTEFGYIRNKSIRGAPYDFRKAPNEMGKFQIDLRILIEKMYRENSNMSVIIVAHSMGNMYIIRLLNAMTQTWKDKYIKGFISISPPYSGALDALRTALSGNNERIFILSPTELRSAQNTWPSTYYLMPVPSMWSPDVILSTDQGNYTASLIYQILYSSGIPHAVDHWKDIAKITQIPAAPNVPLYCIYSNDFPTVEYLDYRGGKFPNNKPKIRYGPGDGTVNLQSLKQCSDFKYQQTQPVTTTTISSVKHLDIMRDERLLRVINQIIRSSQ